jgi:hypothetical protein
MKIVVQIKKVFKEFNFTIYTTSGNYFCRVGFAKVVFYERLHERGMFGGS